MFVKNDTRRVVIVDVAHLFYKFAFGQAAALSCTVMRNGVPVVVDTTLPAHTIKLLHRWADYGRNPLVVCFDSRGGCASRKAYFAKYNGIREGAEPIGYKGKRQMQDSRFYDGVNLTSNILQRGGVCVLKADGYEADDLIKAAVDKAKIDYPYTPIDVVTGDRDLLPLVDDQVSVFISSRKTTYATDKSLEKRNYVQITPANYQAIIEDLTDYRKLSVPYNTILLTKLLRGDKSDEIPGYPKFTPTLYNKLIDALEYDKVDLTELCRYGNPTETICYRGIEEPIPEGLIATTPEDQKMIKFGEPKELTRLCDVLSNYIDDKIIDHVRFVYNGINLNGAFTGLTDRFNRRPAKITAKIQGYQDTMLQSVFNEIQGTLPYRK